MYKVECIKYKFYAFQMNVQKAMMTLHREAIPKMTAATLKMKMSPKIKMVVPLVPKFTKLPATKKIVL